MASEAAAVRRPGLDPRKLTWLLVVVGLAALVAVLAVATRTGAIGRGNLVYDVLVDPFVLMVQAPDLLVQTVWEGLVSGVLYALIALGFVLIFKASGVFNFAQGIMVVFAALTLVGLYEKGVPALLALALSVGVMFVLALAVERIVLGVFREGGRKAFDGLLHHRARASLAHRLLEEPVRGDARTLHVEGVPPHVVERVPEAPVDRLQPDEHRTRQDPLGARKLQQRWEDGEDVGMLPDGALRHGVRLVLGDGSVGKAGAFATATTLTAAAVIRAALAAQDTRPPSPRPADHHEATACRNGE